MRVLKGFQAEEVALKNSSKTPSGSLPTMDAFVNGFAAFLADHEEGVAEIRSEMEQLRPKLIEPMESNQNDLQNFMATLKGNLRSPVTISNMGISEPLGWATLWTLQTLELFEVDENAQEKLSDLLGFNLDEVLAEEVAKEDEIVEEPEPVAEENDESPSEPVVEIQSISTEQMNSLDELESHINTSTNHFEILGVSHTDTVEDFRKAYFELSKKLHPDRFSTAGEDIIARATNLFDKVREAHDVLSDDTERAKYIDVVIYGKASDEEAHATLQAMWKAEEAFKKNDSFKCHLDAHDFSGGS